MSIWTTEHTITTPATPERVFAVWADVPAWPTWDTGLISATLDGPFVVGTTGTLHPEGAPGPLPFTLTQVTPGREFTDRTEFAGHVLTFEHLATATAAGTEVTVRVIVEGPDADHMGPGVADDLPEAMTALVGAAEATPAP
ncbi:MAG: SRPBCC family protein [Thermoleophilia bacterium]